MAYAAGERTAQPPYEARRRVARARRTRCSAGRRGTCQRRGARQRREVAEDTAEHAGGRAAPGGRGLAHRGRLMSEGAKFSAG